MRTVYVVIVVAGLVVSVPAYSINRCTGADGKIVFQDMPCQGAGESVQVKPAAGPAASPTGAGTSEAQRLEAIVANSQRDRRRLDLRDRLVPDAEGALADHRAACHKQQAQLADSQYVYRQNLYGKTHAAQIASEMAAAAALCDTKDRELQRRLDALTAECAALKCR